MHAARARARWMALGTSTSSRMRRNVAHVRRSVYTSSHSDMAMMCHRSSSSASQLIDLVMDTDGGSDFTHAAEGSDRFRLPLETKFVSVGGSVGGRW